MEEKYKIYIERQLLRLDKKGKISKKAYPKTFGDKEKNNFIKTVKDTDSILVLITPKTEQVSDCFNKLQEITDVVYVECYNENEIVWPYARFENQDLSLTLNLEINKTLIENFDIKVNSLKENFNSIRSILENRFGKIEIRNNKNKITLKNIMINSNTRFAITQNDILFLISVIFASFEKMDVKSVSDLKKVLEKVNKNYSLKAKEAINDISLKLNDKNIELSEEDKFALAIKFMQEGYDTRYSLEKYQKIVPESVCIIKDAISQGINYSVLNENKSVVELDLNGHKEFVIEGNKTDRDNYIFPIITDDKFTSKQIMKKAGINVPTAMLLEKDMTKEDIEELVSPFYNKKLVVKPRNTNYGTGITVFSKNANKSQIMNAIEYAFRFDDNVLIEEYVKGMEYRFLVVNGKCESVCHRRTASIVGDGKSTIKELMIAKSAEAWHRLTKCPVKIEEPVEEFLKLQNLNYDSIVEEGKRIFLRTNSNCSTGGESIDYTYTMPEKFKKIAEKAAKAFDAKICGVDIIIDDMEKDNYAIIEINDNPGYSINEWPYEGKGERIGLKILKLLNMEQ